MNVEGRNWRSTPNPALNDHGPQNGGLPIEARNASVKARTFALGCGMSTQ